MRFPEEEILGADQRELPSRLILEHIVPIPRVAALIDITHKLPLPLLGRAPRIICIRVLQVAEADLAVQVFLELQLISDFVQTDKYLLVLGGSRKVLVGLVFDLALAHSAPLLQLYPWAQVEVAELLVDFRGARRVLEPVFDQLLRLDQRESGVSVAQLK